MLRIRVIQVARYLPLVLLPGQRDQEMLSRRSITAFSNEVVRSASMRTHKVQI